MASRAGAPAPHRSSTHHSVNGGHSRTGGSMGGFDLNARRMSFERLAVHPYAYAAMQQNSSVYGPGAVSNMGAPTGMGANRFRPTLPATTHRTPTGAPTARSIDLPLSPSSTSSSQIPSILGSAPLTVFNDDLAMEVVPSGAEASQHTDLAARAEATQLQNFQQQQSQRQGAHPHFDDMGRIIDQLGGHNVVTSPRSNAPSAAGPLPDPDVSFGLVGRDGSNGGERSNDASSHPANEHVPASAEAPLHVRTSTVSESSFAIGFAYQQTNVKPESQDSHMADVLDPTSNPLTQHQLGSTVSIASLSENETNGANAPMYYRDNSSGIVPLANYPARFGSIVSIAESESSIAMPASAAKRAV